MRAVRLGLLVILGLGLLGLPACAGSGGQLEPGGEDSEGAAAPTESHGMAASLDVQVAGDGVRLGLHVTNTTSRTIDFTFPTSQRYDFVVRRPSGEEVWRWSDGMAFLQAISHATLAPGESWDMEAVWEPGATSGTLEATGTLTARDHPVSQHTTFELP